MAFPCNRFLIQLCKIKKDSRAGANQGFVLPDTLEKLFSTGSFQQSYYPLNARKVSWGYLLHKHWLPKLMGGSFALAPFLLKQWYLGHCLWIWLLWVSPLLCLPFTWPVNNFPHGLISHCWWTALHEHLFVPSQWKRCVVQLLCLHSGVQEPKDGPSW